MNQVFLMFDRIFMENVDTFRRVMKVMPGEGPQPTNSHLTSPFMTN